MAAIMPISELIENPIKLSILCHSQNEPVFLTKNGYGDMVVMSVEQYETLKALADSAAKGAIAPAETAANARDASPDKKNDSSISGGIQRLALDDVVDIMKEEVNRNRTFNDHKRRFP